MPDADGQGVDALPHADDQAASLGDGLSAPDGGDAAVDPTTTPDDIEAASDDTGQSAPPDGDGPNPDDGDAAAAEAGEGKNDKPTRSQRRAASKSAAEPAKPASTFDDATIAEAMRRVREADAAEATRKQTEADRATANAAELSEVHKFTGSVKLKDGSEAYDALNQAVKRRGGPDWDRIETIAQELKLEFGDSQAVIDQLVTWDDNRGLTGRMVSRADRIANERAWDKIDADFKASADLLPAEARSAFLDNAGSLRDGFAAFKDALLSSVRAEHDATVREHEEKVKELQETIDLLEAEVPAARGRRAAAAASRLETGGRPSGTRIFTRSDLAGMTVDEFRANRAEIERQSAAGLIK